VDSRNFIQLPFSPSLSLVSSSSTPQVDCARPSKKEESYGACLRCPADQYLQ
jgi:hypothetical protein